MVNADVIPAEEEFVKSDNNASLEEAGDASKGDVSLGKLIPRRV